MSNQLSITSTRWPAAPSGGSLPILYEMHSDLGSWATIYPDDIAWDLPTSAFQWSAADETTDGKVRITAAFDIDSTTPAETAQDMLSRMLCVFIVGHLTGKALGDACRSLLDIVSWQTDQMRPALPRPEPKRHAVVRTRRVERAPFTFDVD